MSINDGYRCHLPDPENPGQDGESYGYIGFDGWCLHLTVSNFQGTRCNDCKAAIGPGEGVERKTKRGCHTICMECVKNLLCEHELGFFVTLLFNLQACIMHHGRYTGQQVFDGIRRISETRAVTFEVTFSGERKHKSKGVGDGPRPERLDQSVHPGPGTE